MNAAVAKPAVAQPVARPGGVAIGGFYVPDFYSRFIRGIRAMAIEPIGDIADVSISEGTGPSYPSSLNNRWPFDEGSGTTAADSEGSNDLTIDGATWTADSDAVGGQILDFDGSDDDLQGSFSSTFTGDSDHSIAYTLDLANTNTSPSGAKHVLINTDGSNKKHSNTFGNSGSDEVEVAIRGGSMDSDDSADISGFSGLIRVCVAIDVSSNSITIYINGSSQSSAGGNANFDNTSQGLYFGENGAGNKRIDGRIDNPAFYTSELTSSEATDDYNAQPWS